jgi:hypothetical protein
MLYDLSVLFPMHLIQHMLSRAVINDAGLGNFPMNQFRFRSIEIKINDKAHSYSKNKQEKTKEYPDRSFHPGLYPCFFVIIRLYHITFSFRINKSDCIPGKL